MSAHMWFTEMIKPGGTTGLYRGRVMKKKVVCVFLEYIIYVKTSLRFLPIKLR